MNGSPFQKKTKALLRVGSQFRLRQVRYLRRSILMGRPIFFNAQLADRVRITSNRDRADE
jgi:hypothetical protein